MAKEVSHLRIRILSRPLVSLSRAERFVGNFRKRFGIVGYCATLRPLVSANQAATHH